jgi:hypothetical protein
MSAAKKLALIAVGYALAVAGGYALAAVNEALIPADVSQASGGMVAFGDMIVLVLGAGLLSLVPTWFLLKLWAGKAPRALVAALLAIAVTGPVSWLAVACLAGGPVPHPPQAVFVLLGPLIAFGAIPRIVVGPVLLVIEGATFFLVKGRVMRGLVAAAMLMDLVPLGLYALRMASAIHR